MTSSLWNVVIHKEAVYMEQHSREMPYQVLRAIPLILHSAWPNLLFLSALWLFLYLSTACCSRTPPEVFRVVRHQSPGPVPSLIMDKEGLYYRNQGLADNKKNHVTFFANRCCQQNKYCLPSSKDNLSYIASLQPSAKMPIIIMTILYLTLKCQMCC